jgi:polar amino acid transport system ATP-binding protein
MKSVPDVNAALLQMRGVSKSYGERKILDRIDLDVAAREKVAIIGPSGSGKTTILRIAIGLVKPDEGTIRVDGAYLWHEETQEGLTPVGERHP